MNRAPTLAPASAHCRRHVPPPCAAALRRQEEALLLVWVRRRVEAELGIEVVRQLDEVELRRRGHAPPRAAPVHRRAGEAVRRRVETEPGRG